MTLGSAASESLNGHLIHIWISKSLRVVFMSSVRGQRHWCTAPKWNSSFSGTNVAGSHVRCLADTDSIISTRNHYTTGHYPTRQVYDNWASVIRLYNGYVAGPDSQFGYPSISNNKCTVCKTSLFFFFILSWQNLGKCNNNNNKISIAPYTVVTSEELEAGRNAVQ